MSRKYRLKPKPERDEALYAAKYEPGQPLDELYEVARMGDGEAVLAEAPLPGETVLVARYINYDRERPEIEFEVVRPGRYLTFSTQYGSLGEDTEAGLQQWYEPYPEVQQARGRKRP